MIYEKLLVQADDLKSQKRFSEAISLYKEALDMGAEESECYFSIANCYYHLKDDEQSILYYRRGLVVDPKNEQATFLLALTYYFAQQDNAALITFRKLLEINPDSSDAHYFIGIMEKDLNIAIHHLEHALMGDMNKKQEMEATITLQRKLLLLGLDFAMHGKPEKAKESMDKALRLGQFEENSEFFKEVLDIMK